MAEKKPASPPEPKKDSVEPKDLPKSAEKPEEFALGKWIEEYSPWSQKNIQDNRYQEYLQMAKDDVYKMRNRYESFRTIIDEYENTDAIVLEFTSNAKNDMNDLKLHVDALRKQITEHKGDDTDAYWSKAQASYVTMRNNFLMTLTHISMRECWKDIDAIPGTTIALSAENLEKNITREIQPDGNFPGGFTALEGLINETEKLMTHMQHNGDAWLKKKNIVQPTPDEIIIREHLPSAQLGRLRRDVKDLISGSMNGNPLWKNAGFSSQKNRPPIHQIAQEFLKTLERSMKPVPGAAKGTVMIKKPMELLETLHDLSADMEFTTERHDERPTEVILQKPGPIEEAQRITRRDIMKRFGTWGAGLVTAGYAMNGAYNWITAPEESALVQLGDGFSVKRIGQGLKFTVPEGYTEGTMYQIFAEGEDTKMMRVMNNTFVIPEGYSYENNDIEIQINYLVGNKWERRIHHFKAE